jgi:hypothetical protein
MAKRRKGVPRLEAYWTPEEYRAALESAAQLAGLPPRGKRGSKANKVRQRMGGTIAWLARQILWTRRAQRVNEGHLV